MSSSGNVTVVKAWDMDLHEIDDVSHFRKIVTLNDRTSARLSVVVMAAMRRKCESKVHSGN